MSTLRAYLGVAGLTDVGFTLYDQNTIVVARQTTGILDEGGGFYSVTGVTLAGDHVRWDSTGTPAAVAREDLSVRIALEELEAEQTSTPPTSSPPGTTTPLGTPGGLTYGAAKAMLARVVENGLCDDDSRVMLRVNEATKAILDEIIPVNGCATYDVVAVGTTITLPPELENAYDVEVLADKKVRGQTDVTQSFYDLVNPFTYVDPAAQHDNPLVDMFLVPDGDDPTLLRRMYDYPGLAANSTVRVTGAKRYRPITSDADYLIVQNILALKLMIKAIEMYEHNDSDLGDKLAAKSIGLLTAEVKKHQLDPRNTMRRKAAYDADLQTYMQGTFGYTRARLAHEVPGALNLGKSELTRVLEQAEMRLLDKGHFVGSLEEFRAKVYNGHILFPARVKSVLAANIGCGCNGSLDIRSIFFQFLKNGPGMEATCAGILFDEGEVYFRNTGQVRRKYRLAGGTNGEFVAASVANTVNEFYNIGTHARFVALENGIALEILDDATGTWIRQWEQTE